MLTSLSTLDLHVKPDWTGAAAVTYPRRMASDDPIRKNVGLRLKAAREMADMTQDFVAKLFEVGKGTVSAWETGGCDPGIYRLRRLAKLYKVTSDALLWDETPSREAQKIAVGYDALNDKMRRKFDAMWMAEFAGAATDNEVEASFKEKSEGKYKMPTPIAEAPASVSPRKAPKRKAMK